MSVTWTWTVQERPSLRDEVRASDGGCLIVGPAGVGKTTLARQALDASDRPAVVVRGIEGLASVPFAALSAARAEQDNDDVDHDVVRRLRSWLSGLAQDGVWILVDDADALDPPSSGLLSYAAQTEDLHLVVTMRTGHHLPNDLDRVALHRSWSTIAIEPWTVTELSDALSSTLGGPVALDLARAVHALSGGIPLVARELVFDGIANDRIHFDGQTWRGAPSVGSPESAARLIGRRLPSGGPSLAVLQMLAIAGQLRPEMLDLVASEDALIELDAQGLLEYGSGSALPYVRLAHPMVADALRSGLDAGERRQLLVTLVEAGSSLASPDELDVLQTLHWAVEVGHDLSPDQLRDGSALALRHMDYALAADIAGALRRLEPSAPAAFVHAVALARAARFDEALEIADEARALAEEPDEVVALARILVRLHSPFGRTLGYVGGRPDHAAEVAAWADDRLGTASFTTMLASYTSFVEGDLSRSVDLAARVAEDPALERSGVRREADEHLMLIAPIAGRFDIARASQLRLSADARVELHLPALMSSEGTHASLLMYDGRLREALAADESAFERAERVLAYDEMMNASAQRGIRSYLMGDMEGTVEALELSLRYRVVPSSRSLLVQGILATARARSGELATAVRTLDQADLERETFSSILLNLDYDHLSTYVRAAAGLLDRDEAADRLRVIAAEADGFDYQWLHTITRLSIVRLGAVRAEDGEALAGAAALDARFIRTAAQVVVAASRADVDQLVHLADELATMDAHCMEVDALMAAAAAAVGSDAEPVRQRLDRAVASCVGLVLPTDAAAAGLPGLTEREAEIARLAGEGLASKEIAGQLGLSSRTVDNTLRRVYAKLGIAGRRELRAALHR